MALDDKLRWDKQYQSARGVGLPSQFLRECLESASWPARCGKALDIACGQGRNAIYLAQRGFEVTAVDVSSVALDTAARCAAEQNFSIHWQQADLETLTLPADEYDLVINFNYLQRSLIEPSKRSVKKGGCVIFETYLIDQASSGHPRNPDYLLGHNELLEFFCDFRVLHYHEGKFGDSDAVSFRAGILAERRAN